MNLRVGARGEILKAMPWGRSDTSCHPQVWWGALGSISCFKSYSKLPLMERTRKATVTCREQRGSESINKVQDKTQASECRASGVRVGSPSPRIRSSSGSIVYGQESERSQTSLHGPQKGLWPAPRPALSQRPPPTREEPSFPGNEQSGSWSPP